MTRKTEINVRVKAAKVAAPKDVAVKAAQSIVAKTKVETPVASSAPDSMSVETTPFAQGVSIMTDTVKATAEKTAEKATEFFADIREKATEAAEKGKKFAAEAVEFNKANVEAVVEAGKIVAKGTQEIGKTNMEFAKKNFEEVQVAVKELTSVKSPTDFVKLQGELARKGFDTAVAQGSKNTEAMVKLVSEMFQPISNRIAATTELFKKAA
ncbi:phasin family protein [Sphingorhabdus sp.]|jgi:phasin family protein|uniref:phasin family protein n=1 Tax=Sphingorhabdus sp. TaxID=1902408 RepID=UPI003D818734